MARLSNLLRSGDGTDEPGLPIICRPAVRAEIEPGLRVILADGSGLGSDDAVLDFLSFAVHRKIDVNSMWVAERNGRIDWALLPIVSPGRTMLLFTPHRLNKQTPPAAVGLLAEAICRHFGQARLVLAQLLLDPRERMIGELYRNAGFEDLAELIYLQRSLQRAPAMEPPPPGCAWVNYSPETHSLFANTIQASYESSLDCPALNGRREIEDVIAGHKATGMFDPSMWFVVHDRGIGRGVLLLNPTTAADSVELVYLGLTPAARGTGLADHLMRLALYTTAQRDFRDVSLAVDGRNEPALRLYLRHGMKRVGCRRALVRDLRLSV